MLLMEELLISNNLGWLLTSENGDRPRNGVRVAAIADMEASSYHLYEEGNFPYDS